jgi:hypothetical protein
MTLRREMPRSSLGMTVRDIPDNKKGRPKPPFLWYQVRSA